MPAPRRWGSLPMAPPRRAANLSGTKTGPPVDPNREGSSSMSTQTLTRANPAAATAEDGPARARRLPRIRRLAVVALAPVLLLAAAIPAEAYTITARSSVPVAPTIYKVQGAHKNVGSAVTGPMWKPWI